MQQSGERLFKIDYKILYFCLKYTHALWPYYHYLKERSCNYRTYFLTGIIYSECNTIVYTYKYYQSIIFYLQNILQWNKILHN